MIPFTSAFGRKVAIGVSALVCALAGFGTGAARAEMAPPQGFYIGAGVLHQWSDASYHFMTTNERGSIDPDGIGFSVFGGYLWNNGSWVYGVEATFTGHDASASTVTPSGITFTQKNNHAWSVRGRLGKSVDQYLYYVTGGYTRATITHSASNAGGAWSNRESRNGWLAGIGVERRLNEKVSLRLELTHAEYESAICLPPPPAPTAPGTPHVGYDSTEAGASIVINF